MSDNPKLEYLICESNELTSLDVSNNPKLTVLMCSSNRLGSLDVSTNPDLKELQCSKNMITELDLSYCPELVNVFRNGEKEESGEPDYYAWSYTSSSDAFNTLLVDKTVNIETDPGARILKVDENGEPLAGAVLQILDMEGNVAEQWTSTEEVHRAAGLLSGTEYTLHELEAPEGYEAGEDIRFLLDGAYLVLVDGTPYPDGILRIVDTKLLTVQVLKVDENGEALAGAKMQLLDAENKEVAAWTSTGEAEEITGLKGLTEYTVHELEAPEGYAGADADVTFQLDGENVILSTSLVPTKGPITVVNTKLPPVKVLKVDENGEPLAGATLQIIAPDGSTAAAWTSTGEAYEVEGLLPGSAYRLQEVKAPEGYAPAEEISFIMAGYGEPSVAGVPIRDGTLTITNLPIPPVYVLKVNDFGEPLAGAKLQLLDSEGNVIDEWTSTTETHEINGLVLDETYTVHETTAPEGYKAVGDVSFVLNGGETVSLLLLTDNRGSPYPAGVPANNGTVVVRNEPIEVIIKITKNVTGGATNNGPFQFTYTFTSNGQQVDCFYEIRDEESGEIVYRGQSAGEGELALEAGQTAEFHGLYYGTVYSFTEAADPRYGVTVETEQGTERTNSVFGTLDTPTGQEVIFTNSPLVTDITVTKRWEGGRPANDSIVSKLTLYANGKEVKDAVFVRNGDDYTVYSLPMYDENGNAIHYTVKESKLSGYYDPTYTSKEGRILREAEDGSTITNEKPPYVPTWEIKVKKEWSGVSQGEKLPNVTLDVYRLNEDGSSTWVKKVTWSAKKIEQFGGYIHIYNLSRRGTYYVVEQVPVGFTVRYENIGNYVGVTDRAYDNGTIKNHQVPHTGDERPWEIWAAAAGISAVGIALVVLREKRRKKNA